MGRAHGYPLQIARADLHGILWERARQLNVRILPSTSVSGVKPLARAASDSTPGSSGTGEGVEATLGDGALECFDMVVGADGVSSSVRASLGGPAASRPMGIEGWLFWLDLQHPYEFSSTIGTYWGNGISLGLYPQGDRRRLVGYLALAQKAPGVSEFRRGAAGSLKEFLKARFRPFERARPDVFQNLPEEDGAYFHHIHLSSHARVGHRDRVVLLGDAAHATSPFIGMGSAMAIEDAVVLARELATMTSPRDIPFLCGRYVDARKKRVRAVLTKSSEIELFIRMRRPMLCRFRNRLVSHLYRPIFLGWMDRFVSERI